MTIKKEDMIAILRGLPEDRRNILRELLNEYTKTESIIISYLYWEKCFEGFQLIRASDMSYTTGYSIATILQSINQINQKSEPQLIETRKVRGNICREFRLYWQPSQKSEGSNEL